MEAGEQALKALQTQDQAEGFGAPLTISRQDPGNLPRTLVDAVMRMDAAKLPGFAGVPSGSDYVLARLDKVEAGQPDAQAAEMLARQLGGAWGEAEDQAVLKMLREAYKVQILPPAAPIIKGDQPAEG
ncbi:peptidyl-prolyl cis-trans isomerase domain protein [Bordetella holmesii 70147]|nr:peptidyl-prolyl cis-trans isomerase domain protein [Bordetella holmesii 70147]